MVAPEAVGWVRARLRKLGAGILQKLVKRPVLVAESPGYWSNGARNRRFRLETQTMKLDRYDRAIVRALQLDGRITNSQLAESVSLSESACLRRVRALEKSGFIEGYTALINQQKAGCPVNVFVNITLERQEQAHLHAFEEAARKVPEVMECYLMSGEYDFLLRVVLADTADFERLHSQHLTRLPNVARVHSSFALRTVQKSRELPIR
jgi:Lrp/AsnC family transcriptional regulator, leucine-responsive regulatory protein